MTRGKHGAQADRRRNAQTDAELERLRGEVAQWKRLAGRYVNEAQRVPGLERALRKARGEIGVPDHEHEKELADLETRWALRWDEAMSAVEVIVADLFRHVDPDGNYLNVSLLDAMRALPEDTMRAATDKIWTREDFRTFLHPRTASAMTAGMHGPITAAALSRGYTSGKIPVEVLEDPTFNAQVDRLMRQPIRPLPGRKPFRPNPAQGPATSPNDAHTAP